MRMKDNIRKLEVYTKNCFTFEKFLESNVITEEKTQELDFCIM